MAVTKRPGKDGMGYRVTVDYPTDPLTGKRKQRSETYRTKKEADAREREWLTEIERGTAVDGTKMTVGEYLDHWLAVIRTEVRGSTWVRHECEIRKHLIPGIGRIPMKKLTPLAIQNHYVSCATSLAPSTIRRSYAVLHKALDQAVIWGMVERNSARGIVLPKDEHREMQVWDEDQVRTFLVATEDDPQAALWRLAVLIGLRKGELLALQWNDTDLTRSQLHVQRTRTIDDHSRPIVNEPKTKAGRRTITLPMSCVAALKVHKHTQNLHIIAHRDIWHDENLVFPTADGNLQWPVMPVYALDKIIKRTGLPKIRFHDLRHTAATLMLLQGISPRVVQERLGHASLAMTLGLYSHVTLTMQEDAAAKMDRMFA